MGAQETSAMRSGAAEPAEGPPLSGSAESSSVPRGGQRSSARLDPRVAPCRISSAIRRTSRWISREDATPTRPAGIRPFPRDQLPMPAQQRVRRRDRGDLPQDATTHPVGSRRQPASIVVGQAQSRGPSCRLKRPISSIRYAIASRSRRSSQLVSTHRSHSGAPKGRSRRRSLYHGRFGPFTRTSIESWNRTGFRDWRRGWCEDRCGLGHRVSRCLNVG